MPVVVSVCIVLIGTVLVLAPRIHDIICRIVECTVGFTSERFRDAV